MWAESKRNPGTVSRENFTKEAGGYVAAGGAGYR